MWLFSVRADSAPAVFAFAVAFHVHAGLRHFAVIRGYFFAFFDVSFCYIAEAFGQEEGKCNSGRVEARNAAAIYCALAPRREEIEASFQKQLAGLRNAGINVDGFLKAIEGKTILEINEQGALSGTAELRAFLKEA